MGLEFQSEVVEVFVEKAPFDEAYRKLRKWGVDIATLYETAKIRMLVGYENNICKEGNWSGEVLAYFPEKVYLLPKQLNPILNMPEDAVKLHRQGKEFFIPADVALRIEKSAKDPNLQILTLSDIDTFIIPTNEFHKNYFTRFVFRDLAQAYGNFLQAKGISSMPVRLLNSNYIKSLGKPFIRPIWFHCLCSTSGLYGDYHLYCNVWVRGVKELK